MRWLYEKTRLILFPVFGPIPVKLRTHIGEPIPYDPNITAEELAEKVSLSVLKANATFILLVMVTWVTFQGLGRGSYNSLGPEVNGMNKNQRSEKQGQVTVQDGAVSDFPKANVLYTIQCTLYHSGKQALRIGPPHKAFGFCRVSV